jgi:hypothetical protein
MSTRAGPTLSEAIRMTGLATLDLAEICQPMAAPGSDVAQPDDVSFVPVAKVENRRP